MPTRRGVFASLLLLAVVLGPAAPSLGDGRFAEEPTAGLELPAGALAGDHDATAVSLNPAGLPFLGGGHFELVYTGLDDEFAGGPGSGLGLYAATPVALPLLPRLGFGVAVEHLIPPRLSLVPDPGEPTRVSLSAAYLVAPGFGVGLSWHRFTDDGGGALDGVDTVDLGLAFRINRHVAFGAVVRDAATPVVAGVPVQRRYQFEAVTRPFGTDRFELGVGASLGERRLDADPSLRFGVRLARGLWLRGGVAAHARWRLFDGALGSGAADLAYDVRASLGLEVSLGGAGATFYGTGGWDVDGQGRLRGGTAIVRWSGERLPSIVPSPDRIERVELTGSPSERSLARTLLGLRRMERDDAVATVVVAIDGLRVGWASTQELRDAIKRLRQRGKTVVAVMTAGSSRDYYVASACDRIYLDAAGGLRVKGLASTVLFFKQLFDDLGVVAQFEKIAEYKSAPEAFTRETSSEPAREMRESLLDDVYGRFLVDVAADRNLPALDVKRIVEGGPYTAAEAREARLVDEVVEPPMRGDETRGPAAERPEAWEYPLVAVIYIDGDIVDGKSMNVPLLGQRLVGGDTIAASIAWARDNPRVKAIVLRIDSPGGSALASEKIAREVQTVRGKKPIIASMGDIAASGGYFAAAYADVILAEPSTITGSIGIFTGKFDLSALLTRLGLTWETVRRGPHADMESYFRPYTDEERAAIQEKLRYYYDRFIGAVAKGRGLTKAEVDAVGRGRVWTGAQARERRLVDRFGGVIDALALAKERAGYRADDRLELVFLPIEPQTLVDQLLRLASGEARVPDAQVPVVAALLRAMPASLLWAPGEPQARLPFSIVWDD